MTFSEFWFVLNKAFESRNQPAALYGEARDLWRAHQDAMQYPDYRRNFAGLE